MPDPVAVLTLLLAALVLVPLGLRLSDDQSRGALAGRIRHFVGWLQMPAAILLASSFALEQSTAAAALAAPWFGLTLLIATIGGLDLVSRGWRLDGHAGFVAAMLYLPFGGGWAVISRAGMRPQEFSDAIVLLTAVHFHYAGFVLSILAGVTANSAKPRSRIGLACDGVMLAAIIVGVPLVGVGISLSPHVEVAAATLLTVGCLLLAVRQLQAAVASRSPTRMTLLGISSLSLVSAMVLAAAYAKGEFTGEAWLSIPTMIRTHGAANALGFASCGLAGWVATGWPTREPQSAATRETD